MSEQRAPISLDLTFEPESDGSVSVIWEAPAALGRRTSSFTSPYAGADLELMLRALDRVQSSSSHASPSGADLTRLQQLGLAAGNPHQVVGRALYAALGAPNLDLLRSHARANNAPLELRLHFPTSAITPPAAAPQTSPMLELVALPWELLWGAEDAPLLLDHGRGSSCTRHLALDRPLGPTRAGGPPLRVLPVIAHSALTAAERERERAVRRRSWQAPNMTTAVRELPEVSPATLDALAAAFEALGPDEQPDIVHIIAHGQYTLTMDGQRLEGHLLLDDGQGGLVPTPISALVPLLKGVRMVTLAVCESGTLVERKAPGVVPAAAGGAVLGGVAQALSAAGVPVVLAMQLVVQAEAAYTMLATIYRSIGNGDSVQTALGVMRTGRYTRDRRTSWYVPVLYLAAREHGPVFLLDSQRPAAAKETSSPFSAVVSADNGGSNTNTTVIGSAGNVTINNNSSGRGGGA